MRNLSEVRDDLRKAGITAVQIARELNVSPSIVRGVLKGRIRGDRGHAHKVAVYLKLKDGVIVPEDAPVCQAIKLAGGAQ